MNEQEALKAVRDQIDAIDGELLRLLNARAEFALKVARIKRENGLGTELYRPDREAQVLRRIKTLNPGPLPDDEVARLVREVMSACLALEQPIKVAYFGPAGTYTHTAARKHFGGAVALTPCASIDEVLRTVAGGTADFGVVPVENSLEGPVNQTLDGLRDSDLQICGEVLLEVHHQLLTKASDLASVARVRAHPQALAQCRHWLDAHCPRAEQLSASSNAEAARLVVDEPAAAAIAGEMASSLYELPILARNIEDDPSNTTRFLVLGRLKCAASGGDRTSLMFVTPNRPGALHDLLGAFAEARISMTRIESRPQPHSRWDYVFFVDIEGHQGDEHVALALAKVAQRTSLLRVLGSYPRAVL